MTGIDIADLPGTTSERGSPVAIIIVLDHTKATLRRSPSTSFMIILQNLHAHRLNEAVSCYALGEPTSAALSGFAPLFTTRADIYRYFPHSGAADCVGCHEWGATIP